MIGQDKDSGILWHNRYKIMEYPVSEAGGNDGRRYSKHTTTTVRPEYEGVAIPVSAYLPRSVVKRARAASL